MLRICGRREIPVGSKLHKLSEELSLPFTGEISESRMLERVLT